MKKMLVRKTALIVMLLMLLIAAFGACSDGNTDSSDEDASQVEDAAEVETTSEVAEESDETSETADDVLSEDEVGEKRIVFLAKKLDSTFWTDMEDGIKRKCEEYGWTCETLAPIVPDDIQEQIELVEQSLIDPPDAYIIGPADGMGIAPAIEQINELDIPIIVVDTKIEDPNVQWEVFVGAQFDYIAEECGKAMDELLGGEGNVIILEGTSGHSTAVDIYNGFIEGLSGSPDIEVIDHQIANWNRQDGLTVTQNLLQKYSDIDAILASNLEMAFGAIKAIEQANREGILVGTINMSDEAVQYLQSGELSFTADDRSDLVGEAAVLRCMDYFRGLELPEVSDIATTIVTGDNLEELGYLEKYGIE